FLFILRLPPISTLFPYTTLFRSGNRIALADVVLEDGTVLLAQVPATTLLELEKRVKEVQDLIAKILTLDPASGFEPDKERGAGIDRKSTRLNSSHRTISYAVFCL